MTYSERVHIAVDTIEKECGTAEIGVILGSGLGDYAEQLEDCKSIKYTDIPGFPQSSVTGHAGIWHTGKIFGKRVALMQGRFHAYEGHSMENVGMPIRAMKLLGVKSLIVTNAAGGVNTDFKPGDLMLINDFINMSGQNPLTGNNLDEFGPRFPDMTYAFDRDYLSLAKKTAEKFNIKLQEGVYAWMNGPSFESPAEIKMLRILGADAVGMSTVPEVIVANHCGIRVLGLSCITNMAAGILPESLDHVEVMETGQRVKGTFSKLINEVIRTI